MNLTNKFQNIRHEGDCYSIVDIVSELTGSSNPRRYWSDLKKKLEYSEVYDNIVQLRLPDINGRMRLTDCADRESLLRIIQSIPSPNADEIKMWLANAGEQNMKETEDPSVLLDKYRNALRSKGYDDNWIDTRLRSVEVREQLTLEWKSRGVEGRQYGILTDIIMQGTFGLSVSEHKVLKGIVKQNLRDNMSTLELIYVILGEETARLLTIKNDAQGFTQNHEVAKKAGEVAGESRGRFEKSTGLKVVTKNNWI